MDNKSTVNVQQTYCDSKAIFIKTADANETSHKHAFPSGGIMQKGNCGDW